MGYGAAALGVTGPRQTKAFGELQAAVHRQRQPYRAGSTDPRPAQLCGGAFKAYGVNIIDEIEVPHVPSGEYVLGWTRR